MSLRQQAIRGVLWAAVQNWGSLLIGTGVLLVMVRLLSAEAFGLAALASALTLAVELVLRQGFSQALVQRDKLEPAHLDTAFWVSAGVGAALTAVGIAAAEPIARLFHEPDLAQLIRWFSLVLLMGGLSSTQQAILQRRLAFKGLALRSLVGTLAGGFVGIGMALKGFGVLSLVGQNLAAVLAGTVVLWGATGWRPGLGVSVRHFKDLVSFGAYAAGSGALAFLSRRADVLLIGYFLGPVLLGYYDVARRLVRVLTQVLTQTVSGVAFPTFSRLQHDKVQMRNAFYTATTMTSILVFPAFFGLLTLAPEAVEGFLGTRWVASVPVLQVLALIGIVEPIIHVGDAALLASGKPSWRLALMAVNTLADLTLFFLVVKSGIVAVAIAFVLRGYFFSPLHLWALQKLLQISPLTLLRQLAGPLSAALVMVLVVLVSKHFSRGLGFQMQTAVCTLGGMLAYSLAIRWFAPTLTHRALELLRSAVSGGKGDPA